MRGIVRIGLVGPPRAGKDTVAEWLCERKGFQRFAFADKIKDEYFASLGLTDAEFEKLKGTDEEGRIRDGLWRYSDEMRAAHGTFHFIDKVLHDIRVCSRNVVVTDIRTREELTTVRIDLRGVIVLVTRGDDLPASGRIEASRLDMEDLPEDALRFENTYPGLEEARQGLEEFYGSSIAGACAQRT